LNNIPEEVAASENSSILFQVTSLDSSLNPASASVANLGNSSGSTASNSAIALLFYAFDLTLFQEFYLLFLILF